MTSRVTLLPSGRQFALAPDETILAAALHQGVNLPYGCRNGFCGACRGRLVSGTIHYPEGEPPGMSDADRSQSMVFCCKAVSSGDITLDLREVGQAAELEIRRMPCRVERMERLVPDVMRLFLKPPQTERLQFLAGQYIDILLADGRRRSFSLANPPHDDALLELHVRRVEGGEFTSHIFERMQPRDVVRIEGPRGQFFVREDLPGPLLLMAGGTGFAPIKSIMEHLLAEGAQRPIRLYWGVRAMRDLYLPELPARWAAQHANVQFVPVLSAPAADDDWQGRTGNVHEAILADVADLAAHVVYASGPPVMVAAAREAFLARGLAAERFLSDAFDYQR